jgi:hypothetical protein
VLYGTQERVGFWRFMPDNFDPSAAFLWKLERFFLQHLRMLTVYPFQ